jgi:hypothetical protein
MRTKYQNRVYGVFHFKQNSPDISLYNLKIIDRNYNAEEVLIFI